jgi:hypothetical protein
MAIDSDTDVWALYDEELSWPEPNEEDLAAWEYIGCGDDDVHCGTPGDAGYITTQVGMFAWEIWEDFIDGCTTATTWCSEDVLYEGWDVNYDGWTMGLF